MRLIPFNRKDRGLLSTRFEDFYDLMEDFFGDSGVSKRGFGGNFKLDVQETEAEYRVDAELPGAKKEEVSVELKDNRLTIAVKKEENLDEEGKNYIHKERRSSSMQRTIYLPDSKAEGVKAKLESGVLTVKIPKEGKAESSIKVSIE